MEGKRRRLPSVAENPQFAPEINKRRLRESDAAANFGNGFRLLANVGIMRCVNFWKRRLTAPRAEQKQSRQEVRDAHSEVSSVGSDRPMRHWQRAPCRALRHLIASFDRNMITVPSETMHV
jgi:hypothetical protein